MEKLKDTFPPASEVADVVAVWVRSPVGETVDNLIINVVLGVKAMAEVAKKTPIARHINLKIFIIIFSFLFAAAGKRAACCAAGTADNVAAAATACDQSKA